MPRCPHKMTRCAYHCAVCSDKQLSAGWGGSNRGNGYLLMGRRSSRRQQASRATERLGPLGNIRDDVTGAHS